MSDPTADPPQRKCGNCGLAKQTMIAMEPGLDKKWWWLCVPCWRVGATPVGAAEKKAALGSVNAA